MGLARRPGVNGSRHASAPFPAVLLGVLLIGLGLPPAVAAQGDTSGDSSVPPSPLELLQEQRGALNLSADQLSRLDDIRDRLASRNGPLVDRMMTLRTEWQQARRAARNGRGRQAEARVERIRAAAQEARQRIQQNNRTAMQEVNRLLSPAQRKQLRGMIQDRRPREGRASLPRRDPGGAQPGENVERSPRRSPSETKRGGSEGGNAR